MNEQIKRINYFALLMTGFLALLIIVPIVLFFIDKSQYDSQGTNIVVFKNINQLEINQGETNSVKQIFKAYNNNLNELFFVVENRQQLNSLQLTLVSLPENLKIIEQELSIPRSERYQYVYLKFSPVPDSKNKVYALTINPLNSQNLKLLTVNKDRYPEGQLFIDGVESNDILVFSFQYKSNEIYKILLRRLSMYKPWFFRYSISFIIIFILYFILVMGPIYYLTKETIENNESIKHFN